MHAYTASPQNPWILESGASSYMTGTKQEYVSLNLSCVHPSVKIVDGTHSPVLGNAVVQATPSLTLTDVLYVSRFPFSLLSISQFTKHNNCKIIFFSSNCVFQDLSVGKKIGSGHEQGGIYYLDDRVTLTGLIAGQHDSALLWHWRLGYSSVYSCWVLYFFLRLCESCEVGHRATFHSRANNHISSAFELVYSDV